MSGISSDTLASGSLKGFIGPLIGLYLASSFFEPLIFDYLISSGNEGVEHSINSFKVFNAVYLIFPLFVVLLILVYHDKRIEIPRVYHETSIKPHFFYFLIVLIVLLAIMNGISYIIAMPHIVFYLVIALVILLIAVVYSLVFIRLNEKKQNFKRDNDINRSIWMAQARSKFGVSGIVTLFIVVFGVCFLFLNSKDLVGHSALSGKGKSDSLLNRDSAKSINEGYKSLLINDSDALYKIAFTSWKEYISFKNSDIKKVEEHLDTIRGFIQKNMIIAGNSIKVDLDSAVIAVLDSMRKQKPDILSLNFPQYQYELSKESDSLNFKQLEDLEYRLGLVEILTVKSLNSKAKNVKSQFEKLFKRIRYKSVLILLTVIIFLMLSYQFLHNNKESLQAKSIVILLSVYGALLVSMMKPIEAKHINIDDESFLYRYTNWYLPHFISDATGVGDQLFDQRQYDVENEYDNADVIEKIGALHQEIEQTKNDLTNYNNQIKGFITTYTIKRERDSAEIDTIKRYTETIKYNTNKSNPRE